MNHPDHMTRNDIEPNNSFTEEQTDCAIDEAAIVIFDLINQFNDPTGKHLLQGYFRTDQDLIGLEANLSRAETHVQNAERQIRETIDQLRMLRNGVEYLISQSKPSTI